MQTTTEQPTAKKLSLTIQGLSSLEDLDALIPNRDVVVLANMGNALFLGMNDGLPTFLVRESDKLISEYRFKREQLQLTKEGSLSLPECHGDYRYLYRRESMWARGDYKDVDDLLRSRGL
jgi:hypothetical protein